MPAGRRDIEGRLTKGLDSSRDLTPEFGAIDILKARFGGDKDEIGMRGRKKKKPKRPEKIVRTRVTPFRTKEEREKYKADQVKKLDEILAKVSMKNKEGKTSTRQKKTKRIRRNQ
jgi:hypothetical protein